MNVQQKASGCCGHYIHEVVIAMPNGVALTIKAAAKSSVEAERKAIEEFERIFERVK